MTLIDTNVILRYLLNDIQEQADKAAEVIAKGAFTLPEIIAEVVYVLVRLYSVPREKIFDIISPLFDEIEIENKSTISDALKIYSESKFDFVDSIVISRSNNLKETVFTFDKKLLNRIKRQSD